MKADFNTGQEVKGMSFWPWVVEMLIKTNAMDPLVCKWHLHVQQVCFLNT